MSMVHTDAVFFEDHEAFEAWLVDNASTAGHVWVRMAKKGSGVTSIDWTTAVDVALCFGWIDGIARGARQQSPPSAPRTEMPP